MQTHNFLALCNSTPLRPLSLSLSLSLILLATMSGYFCTIWDAMRQDRPVYEILEMISKADDRAFKCGERTRDRVMTQQPTLLGAALAYRCDSTIVQAICARTTSNFIYSECLRDLTRLRVCRASVKHVLDALGLQEKGVDYNGWLGNALLNEHRSWFWLESMAGRFLKHAYDSDEGVHQRVLRGLGQLPAACSQIIREVVYLPEALE